jgi:hypothetical protein
MIEDLDVAGIGMDRGLGATAEAAFVVLVKDINVNGGDLTSCFISAATAALVSVDSLILGVMDDSKRRLAGDVELHLICSTSPKPSVFGVASDGLSVCGENERFIKACFKVRSVFIASRWRQDGRECGKLALLNTLVLLVVDAKDMGVKSQEYEREMGFVGGGVGVLLVYNGENERPIPFKCETLVRLRPCADPCNETDDGSISEAGVVVGTVAALSGVGWALGIGVMVKSERRRKVVVGDVIDAGCGLASSLVTLVVDVDGSGIGTVSGLREGELDTL